MSIINKLFTKKPTSIEDRRAQATEQYKKGDYKDAYEIFHELLLMPDNTGWEAGEDYTNAVDCLRWLNREAEMDALRDEALALRPNDWEFATHCTETFGFYLWTSGKIVEGRFIRGGDGDIDVEEQDRLFWMKALLERPVPSEGEHLKDYYLALIRLMYKKREFPDDLWRFQILTDLNAEPDYTQAFGIRRAYVKGIPVDENGDPLFFKLPESWETAKNDGERLRWLFKRLSETGGKADALKLQIKLYWDCYGTQEIGRWLEVKDIGLKKQLRSLSDDETWTKLATGDRRFFLPPEFNPIHLCKELASMGEDEKVWAYDFLVEIYESRYLYEKSEPLCEYLKSRRFDNYDNGREIEHHLHVIQDNWCKINGQTIQLAGKEASIDLRFRNTTSVSFVAYRIDLERIAEDTWKKLLEGTSDYVDFTDISSNISTTKGDCLTDYLLDSKQSIQLSEETIQMFPKTSGCRKLLKINPVAVWTESLSPLEGHLDSEISVITPLKECGAYLIIAMSPQGNASCFVVVLQDLEIIEKKLIDGGRLWQILDARTGCPQSGITLDCLLVETREAKRKLFFHSKKIHKATTITKTTNQEGCVFFTSVELAPFLENRIKTEEGEIDNDKLYHYLTSQKEAYVLAKGRTTDGKRVFFKSKEDRWSLHSNYTEKTKHGCATHFLITDRPVYRPGQQVHIKVWKATPVYGKAAKTNPFAFKELSIRITDAEKKKLDNWKRITDSYGGMTLDVDLPKDAKLGKYTVYVYENDWISIGSFQVEEYKKPEYEVSVEVPQKTVKPGEAVPITINAHYYWGTPVADGVVKLTVTSCECSYAWKPSGTWDWLYGNKPQWLFYDYDWYPGWEDWGWSHLWNEEKDETTRPVVTIEGRLSEDGSFSTMIDTSLTKKLVADCFQFDVTAEVIDKSRRTITGTGSFKVSQKPFNVFAWLDRGYLSVGNKATAFMEARSVDGTPVGGKGKITLLQISYDETGHPNEKPVCSWNVSCGMDEKPLEQVFSCSEPGQYRLSCQLTDEEGEIAENGLIFNVMGAGNDGRAFHYNGLELLLDKESYEPGETVRLLVNTEQADSTVMLFVRALNGKVPLPQVLHLNGKSQIVEIPVNEDDMPNIFVEAYTMVNGRFHEEQREIIIPPTSKQLNVNIMTDKQSYLPGEEGKLALEINDVDGKAFCGSLVVSVYDKSLESIVTSRMKNIFHAFWKWKRIHRLETGRHNIWDTGIYWWRAGEAFSYSSLHQYQHSRLYPLSSVQSENCDCCLCANAPLYDVTEVFEDDSSDEKPLATPILRTHFADTALWIGKLETDEQGKVMVKLPFPDDLTTWKICVWSMGEGTCVGEGTAEVKTAKNLLVRLQAPRFFVERDEVVISANVHNYLARNKKVMAELELDEGCLEHLAGSRQTVEVPSQGEQRIDWRVKTVHEGTAVIRVKALTDEESDAVEQSFPVHVHGMDKQLSSCISMRPEETLAKMVFNVPAERRRDTTLLEIRWSPSLALSMVDALPYLLEYPYACTEQTLNRFLPALQCKMLLGKLGLKLTDVKSFTEHLNTQADALQELLRRAGIDASKTAWNDEMLQKIVDTCIDKLRDMRCLDGGWGWFSGQLEKSWPHTTALVVQGLLTASSQCGVTGLDALIRSGVKWLDGYLDKSLSELKKSKERMWTRYEMETNAFVFRVLAEASSLKVKEASRVCLETGRRLFEAKSKLFSYGLALLGVGMHYLRNDKWCEEIIHNLQQYVMENTENQTAWLNVRGARSWFWYDDAIETQAVFIKLLSLHTPQDELLPMLVKYLLNNRGHGAYWKSTRDTAMCIDALAAYLLNSNEMECKMHIDLNLDGQTVATSDITQKNLVSTSSLVIEGEAIKDGNNELTVIKSGKGALYVSAFLRYFSLEEFIGEAGLEIKIKRTVWRLFREDRSVEVPGADGHPASMQVEHFRREALASGNAVKSGDLLEVELVLESQNDYEYLLLEDMLAAGTTPVETKSGYNGNALGAYVEYHDNRVSFFIRELLQGQYSFSYRLRAEVPGSFSALPTKVSAMYAPDLRGNSNEHKLTVIDS